MPTDLNLVVAICGGILSALCGLLTGIAIAAWWLGAKNLEHGQLVKAVADIKASCPIEHKKLQDAIKEAVCAGFKLAMKDLSNQFDQKISAQASRIAVLSEKVAQVEFDIEAIFKVINRRDPDQQHHLGIDGP